MLRGYKGRRKFRPTCKSEAQESATVVEFRLIGPILSTLRGKPPQFRALDSSPSLAVKQHVAFWQRVLLGDSRIISTSSRDRRKVTLTQQRPEVDRTLSERDRSLGVADVKITQRAQLEAFPNTHNHNGRQRSNVSPTIP